jgi:hypothetical protein
VMRTTRSKREEVSRVAAMRRNDTGLSVQRVLVP